MTTPSETTQLDKDAEQTVKGFPIWKLLAFTMAGFLAIMTETMPAGLLPSIGHGLDVSESLAGQLVTLYAVGSVVAAIPVITATRKLNRRPLLLMAIGGLLVFNTVTALSTSYALTLGARFIAGMAAGVVWGLLAGYARRMVAREFQGKALAVVGVGQPIALSLGVPLGAWLGTIVDWRGVFWIMSALALVLLIWIRVAVPDFLGQAAHQRAPLHKIFLTPGIRPILLVVFLWILAHNVLYTYISPFLSNVGLGDRVDLMLLVFGVSAVIGIWLTGMLVDSKLRLTTLVSLIVFSAASLLLGFGSNVPALVFIGVIAWGLAFGGAPTLLQTRIADAAGHEADVAQSMLVTIFNLAVAGGGVVGGVLLASWGAGSFAWAAVILGVAALLVVWLSRRHGFTPGHRISAS